MFSGSLRAGDKIHVFGPKYDGTAKSENYRTEATITGVYLFMGRELVPLTHAPAGAIVGLTGLSGTILKAASISSAVNCPTFSGMYMHVKPIVRVALETTRIADMPKLKEGMKLLSQADPCVEVMVQETGEHVLAAAGEVHVERCMVDLRELFCPGIEIKVSPPIIPFRETVIPPPSVDMTNEQIGNDNKMRTGQHYLLAGIEPSENGVVTATVGKKRWTIKVCFWCVCVLCFVFVFVCLGLCLCLCLCFYFRLFAILLCCVMLCCIECVIVCVCFAIILDSLYFACLLQFLSFGVASRWTPAAQDC